jgi:hypothetical protein
VIGPDIDKPGVAPDVVDAIGIGTRHVGRGKIVPANLPRLFRWKPLPAGIMVVVLSSWYPPRSQGYSAPGIFSPRH